MTATSRRHGATSTTRSCFLLNACLETDGVFVYVRVTGWDKHGPLLYISGPGRGCLKGGARKGGHGKFERGSYLLEE